MASTHQEFEVKIGGRLVAIVSAESSKNVIESITVFPKPSDPFVPRLRFVPGSSVATSY